MNLTFNMPVRVFFGENCVADHVDMLGSFGKKAMILSDPVSAKVTGAGRHYRCTGKERHRSYSI